MDKVLTAVVAVGLAIAYALFAGWLFMLAVGVARAEWLPGLPTIGFGSAVLIAGLLRAAFASFHGSRESK